MKRKKKSGINWSLVIGVFWLATGLFSLGREFPTDIQKRLAYLDGWRQAFNYDWHTDYIHGWNKCDPTPVPTPNYLTSDYNQLTSASR